MEKKIDTRTASQRIDADIISLIKSKHTLIWIVTRDERRVESALAEIAYRAKLALNIWDCSQGLYTQQTSGKMEVTDDSVRDSMSMLTKIRQTPKRCLYVMRDLHKWLADPYVLRALRTLSRDRRKQRRHRGRRLLGKGLHLDAAVKRAKLALAQL